MGYPVSLNGGFGMNAETKGPQIRISADSHMAEPPDLWEHNLPARFRERALRWPNIKLYETNHHLRAGGWDPHARLQDLALDGTAAEVLFPTQGAQIFGIEDHELEAAHIRVYNDWLIDFCSVASERFWGLALISLWDVDQGIAELERCRGAGLRGASIWIAPPTDMPYSSDHYERFWDAAQALDAPLCMHINSRAAGLPRMTNPNRTVSNLQSVNGHKFDAMGSLGHLIASGVLERYPHLKFLVAEIGCGWIPFWLQEFDYYVESRHPLPQKPSDYFNRQVMSTFISDAVGGYLLKDFGEDNFLWSNDYPHPACTWPDSGIVIEEGLGHLAPEVQEKVVWRNIARMFNGGEPPPAADPVPDRAAIEEWLQTHTDFGARSRLKSG